MKYKMFVEEPKTDGVVYNTFFYCKKLHLKMIFFCLFFLLYSFFKYCYLQKLSSLVFLKFTTIVRFMDKVTLRSIKSGKKGSRMGSQQTLL